MSFAVDLTQVKDLAPVPNGRYLASIVEAVPGQSAAGNPKIVLSYRIEDGDQEGRVVRDHLTFTANTMFRVKQLLTRNIVLAHRRTDRDAAGAPGPGGDREDRA